MSIARIRVRGMISSWSYPPDRRPPRSAPYRVMAQTDTSMTVLTERPTLREARAVAKKVRQALKG